MRPPLLPPCLLLLCLLLRNTTDLIEGRRCSRPAPQQHQKAMGWLFALLLPRWWWCCSCLGGLDVLEECLRGCGRPHACLIGCSPPASTLTLALTTPSHAQQQQAVAHQASSGAIVRAGRVQLTCLWAFYLGIPPPATPHQPRHFTPTKARAAA